MEDQTQVAKLVLTLDISELRKLLEEIEATKICCKCCQVAQAETSSTIKSTGVIYALGINNLSDRV
ncbi:hypothetical protein [Thorsellia anophelis]|uniref:Uncharacterized protein n=1 Tax=Thorsellia anophelis DSM 18579 TaxID=1123402 RepID=A0A1I0FPG4_9GAMM|nr:hypothetical protein [Thorsellia anophelis]SET60328.1 hypothetical protein SAMN02583745_02855 [Thorsellia anophelis DSM 18579]